MINQKCFRVHCRDFRVYSIGIDSCDVISEEDLNVLRQAEAINEVAIYRVEPATVEETRRHNELLNFLSQYDLSY